MILGTLFKTIESSFESKNFEINYRLDSVNFRDAYLVWLAQRTHIE